MFQQVGSSITYNTFGREFMNIYNRRLRLIRRSLLFYTDVCLSYGLSGQELVPIQMQEGKTHPIYRSFRTKSAYDSRSITTRDSPSCTNTTAGRGIRL
jgi:hypothetical protein